MVWNNGALYFCHDCFYIFQSEQFDDENKNRREARTFGKIPNCSRLGSAWEGFKLRLWSSFHPSRTDCFNISKKSCLHTIISLTVFKYMLYIFGYLNWKYFNIEEVIPYRKKRVYLFIC